MIVIEKFEIENQTTKEKIPMVRHYSNEEFYITKENSDDKTLYIVAEDLESLGIKYIETDKKIKAEII